MEREAQYYIAQGEDVQGPFPQARVLAWIRAGKIRSDMLFSREGGDWVAGHQCPELFPVASAPPPRPVPRESEVGAPAVPARARRGRTRGQAPRRRAPRAAHPEDDERRGHRRPVRRAAPGSVVTVVILDLVAALLYLVLGLLMIGVGSTTLSGSEGLGRGLQILGFIQLVFAGAYIALAVFLLKGSTLARVLQIGLSGLSLVATLVQMTQGAGANMSVALSLALNLLIIVLLLTPAAAAFFAGADPARPARRRSAGGRPARRRRR